MTLDGPPWFELPVGVLVVASSAPEGSSSLRTQQPTVDAQLAEWIEMMLPLLNPQLPLGIKGLISKILLA